MPRARLARLIGFGAERLASYESGRAPLPYKVFTAIAKVLPINPVWLACGGEEQADLGEPVALPSAEALKAPANATFLDVFNGPVAKAMKRTKMPSIGEITLRQINAARYSRWIQVIFRDVPFSLFRRLDAEMQEALLDLVTRFPSDDEIKIFQMRLAYNNIGKTPTSERAFSLLGDLTLSELTQAATSAKGIGVQDQWHRLKQRIQKATSPPGGKSALAKFLGVDLTQLSKWLTDSKSAREPGADYTLKMLQWVQQHESQK